MIVAVIAILAAVVFVIYSWLVIGPTDPVFGLVVTVFLFGAAGLTGPVAERVVPQRCMVVSTSTHRVLQRLGAERFGTMLGKLGWQVRAKLVSRLQLHELIVQVHRSFSAHSITGGLQMGLGLLVLVLGGVWSGATLVILAIVLHVYPALLQVRVYRRFIRLRAHMADDPNSL